MAAGEKTAFTPSIIEQEQSLAPLPSGPRVGLEHGSLGDQSGSVSKMSELAPEEVSPVTLPTATAGSAVGAELNGWSMVLPLDAPFVVQAAKAAPTNDSSSAPLGTPARVLQQMRSEDLYLLDRGDALISRADIASARLYYQRAADAGNAQGALRLGETYDPAFLTIMGARERSGDLSIAAKWYRRAVELGAVEARVLLERSEGKMSTD